jgi:hypothetical protein
MPKQPVSLRPIRTVDLPFDVADPGYDDFGPRPPLTEPMSCRLDDRGGLGVFVDDRIVGTVSWVWMQWGPNSSSRNPMTGSQAQRLLVDLLFRHTSVNRVEAHTDIENLAERRALEKAGFTREGVVRGAQWREGAYHDGLLYAILRAEWAAALRSDQS